jgi:hypothetical protein
MKPPPQDSPFPVQGTHLPFPYLEVMLTSTTRTQVNLRRNLLQSEMMGWDKPLDLFCSSQGDFFLTFRWKIFVTLAVLPQIHEHRFLSQRSLNIKQRLRRIWNPNHWPNQKFWSPLITASDSPFKQRTLMKRHPCDEWGSYRQACLARFS